MARRHSMTSCASVGIVGAQVMKACPRRFRNCVQGRIGAGSGRLFDAAIRGAGELPLRAMLEKTGVQFHLRQSTGGTDKGGKPAADSELEPLWLGANLSESDGKLVFSAVLNGGPAEDAGVAPGDVAVALDGVAFTAKNIKRRLKSYHDGDTLDLVVFRGDELITMRIRLASTPEDTCYLSMDKDAKPEAVARRDAWLNPA